MIFILNKKQIRALALHMSTDPVRPHYQGVCLELIKSKPFALAYSGTTALIVKPDLHRVPETPFEFDLSFLIPSDTVEILLKHKGNNKRVTEEMTYEFTFNFGENNSIASLSIESMGLSLCVKNTHPGSFPLVYARFGHWDVENKFEHLSQFAADILTVHDQTGKLLSDRTDGGRTPLYTTDRNDHAFAVYSQEAVGFYMPLRCMWDRSQKPAIPEFLK